MMKKTFAILNFRKIREEDLYGGYRVSIKAFRDTLSVNLKIILQQEIQLF